MARGTAESVEGLDKFPKSVWGAARTPTRWFNDDEFVIWELGLNEGILEIGLFEDAMFADSFRGEEANDRLTHDGSINIGFSPNSGLQITKNNDATLSPVWLTCGTFKFKE